MEDMTDRSASEIAHELDRERAGLETAIGGLRERLTMDSIVNDAVAYAKENIAPYTRVVDEAVRARPLAAVMAGVGLAWLVFGRKDNGTGFGESTLGGTKYEAMSRWENDGGPVMENLPDPSSDWITEADRLRYEASGALARIDAATREKLRPAVDLARERAAVLGQLASDTRLAMSNGLDTLASEARGRVLAAREKAYAARMMTARQGVRMIEKQPMISGAVAMAIGAAVGSMLPRTRVEDRLFGDERDRVMGQAQEVLRTERTRAGEAVTALADSVTAEIKDKASTLIAEPH